MKFMVEFQYAAAEREAILRRFEERGPNRVPGLTFRGAWVGERDPIAYVLVEGADRGIIESTARQWSDKGTAKVTPVVDVEQL